MTSAGIDNLAAVSAVSMNGEGLSIALSGALTAATLPRVWLEVIRLAKQPGHRDVIVDMSAVSYCDGAGLGLLAEIRRVVAKLGGRVDYRGLAPELRGLIERSSLSDPSAPQLALPPILSFVRQLGRSALHILADLNALVTLLGRAISAFAWAARHPRRIRLGDMLAVAERAGVNAAPVVCLLGLLTGVILAFQCAIPMRRYGAQEAIPAIVAIALTRELGPLLAAVLFAGRSGAAFAAEMGTMTITEEVNALTCLGLDPVRFLVVPRMLAAIAMLPLLTVLCDVTGILGGYTVMTDYGFSFTRYLHAVGHAVQAGDVLGGIAKTFVFAAIIAGVGCLRGLRTGAGPGAVGDSTTRAVVSGIVLVILADAVFGVVFYFLRI